MTTTTFYQNKDNENKYIEVRNDGHYHNSVLQFIQVDGVRTDMANGKFQRIKARELRELLTDYAEVVFCDGEIYYIDEPEVLDDLVQENLDQDVPVFGETPEECNDMEQFICGILEQTFSLALVTEGGKFRYYVDETESDENANTIMYRDGKLLSDNYFAYNSIVEEMGDIYTGKTEPYFISDTMKSAIRSMAENGYFDDDMEQSA